MSERKEVILRTYKNVWKFEREVYSVEGIKLLIPVKPNEVLYFIVSVIITFLLVKFIPFMNRIPFFLRAIAIPYGIMKFLTKQKLDGKLPHKFFIDFIIYKLSPKKYEKFRPVEELRNNIKLTTTTAFRITAFFNKTDEILRKNIKSNKTKCKSKLKLFGRRGVNV
ncbi:conjugal transfer protein [Alkaliphilus pronyensis]|uniref:Conjugal transfer protein n=1 Tax=Alkaliphilus pronyensis TaxID=1482732 RepID=A0A6I0F2V3_9FIRM|nr:TcpE family conjugal transfer membrane protein [Alkaliphilus pronyensis]KAB3535642.1 conjugal transfer protein [Alkaliphilus pronyensis]